MEDDAREEDGRGAWEDEEEAEGWLYEVRVDIFSPFEGGSVGCTVFEEIDAVLV